VILIRSSSISYSHLHFFIQTLTTLDLSQNQTGSVGAQHLADALQTNTVILIFYSSISYSHLHFFTQTLTTLHLTYNEIEYELEDQLKKLIKRNERMIKS
jgi:ABC-type uncharacterized transport system substrate-binding protein